MTTPNIRAALERLVKAVDHGDTQDLSAALDHAHAALAEPLSLEDRIAAADAAIDAGMERVRAIVAPARAALATQPDDLALRVQRLEAMRETERAAVLDLYQQIDKLKARLDWQYTKIGRLEDVIANELEAQP